MILKAKTPYKHKIGDILFGNEYLENVNFDDLKKKKYVYAVSLEPYSDLKTCMDCQTEYHALDLNSKLKKDLRKHFEYDCPFIEGNRYFWFNPSFIFTNTPNKKNIMHQFMEDDMGGWRTDKLKEIEDFNEYKNYNTFGGEKLYMGHGYTYGTLPSDGSNHKDKAMVKLDNGDILVGQTWVWFNK